MKIDPVQFLNPLKLLKLFCILAFFTPFRLFSTHIVGADLYYECINPATANYRVTLKMYRDCLTGMAPYDDFIYLFAFPSTAPGSYFMFEIPKPPSTPPLPAYDWEDCVGSTYPLCVEEGIYSKVITLPPRTGGYNLAWARCCRNENIDNLVNPLDVGVTFLAHVPGPELADCNNLATFDYAFPTFICLNETFYFDHSATDVDGDSLVYKLTNAYTGINWFGSGAGPGVPPPIVDVTNPMGPPPYQNVPYSVDPFSSPFTGDDPFGQSSASIDSKTGFLTITPPFPGVYVVAVSVFEYRGGKLIAENKRDFQVHVVTCNLPGEPPVIDHDLSLVDSSNSGLSITYGSNDTIYAIAGTDFCYQATVRDTLSPDSVFSFPVSDIFGIGSGYFPPAATISTISTGANPVTVELCWSPACEYIGQTIPMIIGGDDNEKCRDYGKIFDTVYIVILPPPVVYPQVEHDITMNSAWNGDTIFLSPDSTLCYNWWVTDSLDQGHLNQSLTVEVVDGGATFTPVTSVTKSGDSLSMTTCWTASCDYSGQTLRFIMKGTDNSFCPPDNYDLDTIYVVVNPVPNPAPVVNHNLSGNIFLNDTIFIEVFDTLCYLFSVNDTSPSADVEYTFNLLPLDAMPAGTPAPVVTVLSLTDSILAQVCWTPSCNQVDRVFLLEVVGTQLNHCDQIAETRDSVYVVISTTTNPPPVITHNFLPGYVVNGDTISIAADSAACFGFTLRDTVWRSYLEMFWHVEDVLTGDSTSHAPVVNFTALSDSLMQGTICFTPGCQFLDQTLMLILLGKDTLDCYPTNWVYDTVWIHVTEPLNNPPVISHTLAALEVVNGTVQVTPSGLEFCYEVQLLDPDSLYADLTAEGVNEIFDFSFGMGNPAEISISGTNPLVINVCWNPSCYDELKDFDLIICGRDTSRCSLTPVVCDSVRFHVRQCTFEVQNVFTPNGDGINDVFFPYYLAGVEFFKLDIFDRWGKLLRSVENDGWNGNFHDAKPVPEGVYYYVVEYKYWSAKGEPLDAKVVGWVTLMR